MEKIISTYLRRYKKDLMSVAFLVTGIVLIFVLIFPQVSEVSNLHADISNQTSTNSNLQDSLNTLNSVNASTLDRDFELTLKSLPLSKSVGTIFETLTVNAGRAGVSIGSLNLQVGSVYSLDQTQTERNTIEGVPFVNLLVRVNGSSANDFSNFARVLYETVPVVEINSIGSTETEGRYDVNFFFKPINESTLQAQNIVAPLTAPQQELLETLRSWNN